MLKLYSSHHAPHQFSSVLQVCQLTELKQTKEWERYPNRFRLLCETLMPENMGKHYREWPAGKQKSSFSFKKITDRNTSWCTLMAQSPKTSQGGASRSSRVRLPSTDEDSAAYTVSTSTLATEVEAVTHALRWIASRGDSGTTRAIIVTDSMSLLQKVTVEWEAQTGMCRWSTSTFENSCECTALDMPG